jgi:hypothetical protein
MVPYLAAAYLVETRAKSLLASVSLASCSTIAAFCAWIRASAAAKACLKNDKRFNYKNEFKTKEED